MWSSYDIINITVTPKEVFVGDKIEITIPPMPGTVFSLIIDGRTVLENIVGGTQPFKYTYTVPPTSRGLHRVVVVAPGKYYGEALFIVQTRITILNETSQPSNLLALNITGQPVNTTLMLYIDDNYLTTIWAEGVEPIVLHVNVPDYISPGKHSIKLVLPNGEPIAVTEALFTESRTWIMLENVIQSINMSTNDIKSGIKSLAGQASINRDIINGINESITSLLTQLINKIIQETSSLKGLNNTTNEKIDSISMKIDKLYSQLTSVNSSLGKTIKTGTGDLNNKLSLINILLITDTIIILTIAAIILVKKK